MRRNIKKNGVMISLILIALIAMMSLGLNTVMASESNYKIEDYVNSDYLINSSGYKITDYPQYLHASGAKISSSYDNQLKITNRNKNDPIV